MAVEGRERPEGRIAQVHRLFEHCVEHRGEVARRRIDDPQHLSSRGLPFQRLSRLG